MAAPAQELATIRAGAPPLIVARKPGPSAPPVREINPLAGPYVAQHGAAAATAYKATQMAAVAGKPLSPMALLRAITSAGLDAIYPNDAAAARKLAPKLTVQIDPNDQGIELLNPAAQAFAYAAKMPFAELYPVAPSLVRWNHGPKTIGGVHGWQEINPAAISYAQVVGRKFGDVYPSPPPWSSDVDGSKDTAIHYSALVGRPFEGDGGVYKNWYHSSGGLADWANNVVSTAGRAVGSAVGTMDQVSGAIGSAISKIPIVGSALAGVWDMAPLPPLFIPIGPVLGSADAITHGKAIDQSALAGLQRAVKDVHAEAPLAETVIALVPGVGPVASGSIAAGLALASGEPIDQVMIDAAAATIPGGALAKGVYRAGVAVMSGKGDAASLVSTAALSIADAAGVPVPDAAKQVLTAGLTATFAIAHGEKPQDAMLDAAIAALPNPAARAAANAARATAQGKNVADVLLQYGPTMIQGLPASSVKNLSDGLMKGMAIGQAEMIQSLSHSQIVNSLGKLASEGAKTTDAVTKAARAAVGPAGAYGFDVGTAMAQHEINRYQLKATRDALDAAQRAGFDAAMSLHAGRVTSKPMSSPAKTAGAAMSRGLAGATPAQKKPVLKAMAAVPEVAAGARSVKKRSALKWAGLVVGAGVGVLAAVPLGALLTAGAVAGGLVGGGVDLIRGHRRPVSHGLPTERHA